MSGDRKNETTEKKAEDSNLGEWVSSEAILKLAPEKPWVDVRPCDFATDKGLSGEAYSSIQTV
jgi:hypothetical protein